MSTNHLGSLRQDQYQALREMLPEFFPTVFTPPAAQASEPALTTDSAPAQPVDGNQLINDVSQFIGSYLQCSEHQRTVLAFWVLHTYCFQAADVTPYVSIQSAQPQAGKTLCLQLLSFLANEPSLTCGLTVSKLSHRMRLARPSSILLDECQAALGTRSRPKAPALRALLATNACLQHGYMDIKQDCDAFCPKAFAGRGPLPEELAELSLPIILEPLRDRKAVKKLRVGQAFAAAGPVKKRLADWAEEHLPQMEAEPRSAPAELPGSLSHLSLRRQDIIEPLLDLAARIGGKWPTRLRQALIAIFEQEAAFNLQVSLDVLNALYGCFCYSGFPARVTTGTLLEWLHTQARRPWEHDGPMTAQKLAKLLAALEVRPRLQRMAKGTNPARGYLLADFQDVWKRHFSHQLVPVLPADALHPPTEIVNRGPPR
jgi:hypothetical protein